MKSLTGFLNPKRKENLKFVLSDAFVDEDGKPLEWEMRQLSAKEGLELKNQIENADYMGIMTAYVAEALVYPDMHDKELLEALSERENKTILKASDALIAMTSDAELAELVKLYSQHNELTRSFSEKKEEAKN